MKTLEKRSLAPMCNNFLNTSHSLSLSLLSLSYSDIPVTKSHCVWPDYNGYRYTGWGRSEYIFIVKGKSQSRTIAVTRHTIRSTQNLFYYFPVTGRFI